MLVLGLGLLIASPQLWTAFRYYPTSIRLGKTAQQKMERGNIPLSRMLRNLIAPTVEPIDGVFGPEAITFIGIPAVGCALWAWTSWWWVVLGLSTVLAAGSRTPVFRWTHRAHLRLPARYTYFVAVSLAMLAIEGFSVLTTKQQLVVLFLQGVSFLLTNSRLWPMQPYVQRWQRPSEAFATPLARYLAGKPGRVSGLPYPLRTGQVNRIHTLGYNGGSQAHWMATLRQDENPNGSGMHDWLALTADGQALDAYGIRYAYTARPLRGKWHPTELPHLYENPLIQTIPSWRELARRDGPLR